MKIVFNTQLEYLGDFI